MHGNGWGQNVGSGLWEGAVRGGSRVQSVAIEIASELLAWFLDKEQPGRFQSIEQALVPWGSAEELPEMRVLLMKALAPARRP